MKNFEKERIKDVIIDYIYDCCFNDKAKILEGGGMKLMLDSEQQETDDSIVNSMIGSIIHAEGPKSVKYGLRDLEYFSLSDDNGVNSSFLSRLERIGIKRNNVSKAEIDNSIQFLCDRSYLVRNAPIATQIKLSRKGILHYENGLSFEKVYSDNKSIRYTNRISRISLIIAIISALASLYFGYQALTSK